MSVGAVAGQLVRVTSAATIFPAADGVGSGVVMGRADAVVDCRRVETDLVAELALLSGLLGARAGVSGREVPAGQTGLQARADQRARLGVLRMALGPGLGRLRRSVPGRGGRPTPSS